MKVETTGAFMLVDPYNGQEIEANGTADVVETPFILERVALGQLKEIKPAPAPAPKGKAA